MIRTNENRVKYALNAPWRVSCVMGGMTSHGTRGGRGGAFPCVLRGVELSTKMLISRYWGGVDAEKAHGARRKTGPNGRTIWC